MQTDTNNIQVVNSEHDALGNAIQYYGFPAYVLKHPRQKSKPNRADRYVLYHANGDPIVGMASGLHYTEMNHFIMGYGNAVNNYSKLVEERQKHLDEINELSSFAAYVNLTVDRGAVPYNYDDWKEVGKPIE